MSRKRETSMAKSATSIQSAFSKIDLKLIQRVEKKIANDMDEALAWARDPDGYMSAKLKGTSRPKGLHFISRLEKICSRRIRSSRAIRSRSRRRSSSSLVFGRPSWRRSGSAFVDRQSQCTATAAAVAGLRSYSFSFRDQMAADGKFRRRHSVVAKGPPYSPQLSRPQSQNSRRASTKSTCERLALLGPAQQQFDKPVVEGTDRSVERNRIRSGIEVATGFRLLFVYRGSEDGIDGVV